jgi:multidrug efflux pump subunit AcrB
VQDLKKAIPRFQAQLPPDVKLSYEFDQSVYVINAVKNLLEEGAIGAILTGSDGVIVPRRRSGRYDRDHHDPRVRDRRHPLSQPGRADHQYHDPQRSVLAIGILVDESTVTIENIHQHLDLGKPKSLAIWDACREIAFSKLLILFCILAVFAPAFSMSGIPGALFLPLALAIGFCMITSYLMAQTFVPVMANWMMKKHQKDGDKEFASDEEEFKASGLRPKSEANLAEEKQKLLEQDSEGGDGKKERGSINSASASCVLRTG